MTIEKVFNPHEPRDWHGRWVTLPGASKLKNILGREDHNGFHAVTHDGKGNEKVVRSFKTQKGLDNFVERTIAHDKTDRRAYKKADALAAVRESGRRDAVKAAAAKAERERVASIRRPTTAPAPAKAMSRRTKATRVQVSETERHTFPEGQQPNMQAAEATAKDFGGNKSERQYAGLVTRLLGKGTSQDPARRGQINDKYGITPKRQTQIESAIYGAAFPNAKSTPRRRNLGGNANARLSDSQRSTMLEQGALSAVALPDSANPSKPDRMFKATKGKNRGKFVVVDSHGDSKVVSAAKAKSITDKSRVYWSEKNKAAIAEGKAKGEKYRAGQDALKEADINAKQITRDAKITAAKKWAESMGLDPNDTYWWGFFNNDPSLVKPQNETADVPTPLGPLPDKVPNRRMNPAKLESALALPDIGSHEMRGHRPGPRKAVKGEPDFKPATPEQRQNSPEHNAMLHDLQIKHDRRAEIRAYHEYLKVHPRSKMKFDMFQRKYRKGTIAKHGFDPKELRDFHGRWATTGGGLRRAAHDLIDGVNLPGERRNKAGSTPVRRSGSRRSNPWDHISFQRLQGREHKPIGPNGKPIAKKNYSPEEAVWRRNNGATKISNTRLKEIKLNRASATPQERDLLLSAVAQQHNDGADPIKIMTARGVTTPQPRYRVMSDIAREMANDAHRAKGEKGAGGQVVRRLGEHHSLKRKKENAKKLDNGRSRWESVAKRQWLLDEFGNGKQATCIICGDHSNKVTLATVSPERIKPGGHKQAFGGVYEEGNVAPAHRNCNLAAATAAQHNPEEYYRQNLKQLLKIYRLQIKKNPSLGRTIAANRRMLKILEGKG